MFLEPFLLQQIVDFRTRAGAGAGEKILSIIVYTSVEDKIRYCTNLRK